MIGRLVLRHEILHQCTKPLLITVTLMGLVLNILAFQMAKSDSVVLAEGARAVLAQYAILFPLVLILWMGRADNRCRPWETGLPLASRPLWWAHLAALSLTLCLLIAATGVAFLGLGGLLNAATGKSVISISELLVLLARPTAVSLAAACLIAGWRPGLRRLTDGPGWSRFRILLLAGAAGLLGLLIAVPVSWALVPVIAGVWWAWRTAGALPPALDSGGELQGDHLSEGGHDWAEVGPSRRVVLFMTLRILTRWPISWLAMGPIAVVFGMMISGARVFGMHEPYLRFTNFFMVVYILFAVSNHFMENLYKIDHLPLGRRGLLGWLVIPVTLFFFLGYGAGRVMEYVSDERAEAIYFDNADENYGLLVPPDVWKLSGAPVEPVITSPAGESHPAQVVPVFQGLPWVLWKPYSTPAGASREFVAWQISRAAAEVYGLDIPPEEIAIQYLDSGPENRVLVKPEGLTLAADFPEARATSSGPVFPLWVGAEIIVLLLVNTIFFLTCRPGITIRKSRIIFWLLMGGLMGLHIGGYLVFIQGWTQEWVVYGFWMGLIRDLGDLGPAGYAVAWLGAILGVGAAWRLAAHALENVEAPST